MQRIDTVYKATDAFGPGRHGFKDGNPLTADPATTLNAAWFNACQEEIARVIESAGLTLDPANLGQLAAVLGLASRSYGTSGHHTFPGGFLLQWSTVTSGSNGDVQFSYPKAFPANRLAAWGLFHRVGVPNPTMDYPTLTFNNAADPSPKTYSNFHLRLNGIGGPFSAFVFVLGH